MLASKAALGRLRTSLAVGGPGRKLLFRKQRSQAQQPAQRSLLPRLLATAMGEPQYEGCFIGDEERKEQVALGGCLGGHPTKLLFGAAPKGSGGVRAWAAGPCTTSHMRLQTLCCWSLHHLAHAADPLLEYHIHSLLTIDAPSEPPCWRGAGQLRDLLRHAAVPGGGGGGGGGTAVPGRIAGDSLGPRGERAVGTAARVLQWPGTG